MGTESVGRERNESKKQKQEKNKQTLQLKQCHAAPQVGCLHGMNRTVVWPPIMNILDDITMIRSLAVEV